MSPFNRSINRLFYYDDKFRYESATNTNAYLYFVLNLKFRKIIYYKHYEINNKYSSLYNRYLLIYIFTSTGLII